MVKKPIPPERTITFTRRHTNEVLVAQADLFMQRYGYCLSAWSQVETALGRWFEQVTRMPSKRMAKNVFYSSRSFLGRSDMLKAAVSDMPNSTEKRFLQAAVVKAVSYSGYRNTLAHGSTMQDADENVVYIIQADDFSDRERRTTITDLENAYSNFRSLFLILSRALVSGHLTPARCEEYLEQLARLPKLAHSNEPTPKKAVRKPRRRS